MENYFNSKNFALTFKLTQCTNLFPLNSSLMSVKKDPPYFSNQPEDATYLQQFIDNVLWFYSLENYAILLLISSFRYKLSLDLDCSEERIDSKEFLCVVEDETINIHDTPVCVFWCNKLGIYSSI